MTISIIIPTYNSSSVIGNCINSVLSQTCEQYEILILDNLSSDNTLSIVDSFQSEKIRVFSHKDNGIYDALNMGIEYATGEWLYFLGSDDHLLDDNVLSDVYDVMMSSDLDFIYGDAYFKNSKSVYGGISSVEKLLLVGNICHQAIFYKKRVFEVVGQYNLKYRIWADWDLNIRCFKHEGLNKGYLNRTIAVFNDLQGVSKDHDEVFKKELPVFYIQEINSLTKCLRSFPYRLFRPFKGFSEKKIH